MLFFFYPEFVFSGALSIIVYQCTCGKQYKPTKKPVEAGYVNSIFLKLYLLCYRCKISYKYKLSVLSIRRSHHNKSSDLYIYIK